MNTLATLELQPISRAVFRTLTESERAWVIAGLKRYVKHRVVTPAFLDQILQADHPGAILYPQDPGYGNDILHALVNALEAKRAKRHRTKSGDPVIAQIRELVPDAYRMMLALERANIDYDVTLRLPDE